MKLKLDLQLLARLGLVITAAGPGSSLAACPPVMILERSTNENRVWYEANENPQTRAAEPITARWEMREKGPGRWENLTRLERSNAYGVRLQSDYSPAGTKFSFAGMPTKVFTLRTDARTDCAIAVMTASDGTEFVVSVVELTMKRSLIPGIERASVTGRTGDGRTVRLNLKL